MERAKTLNDARKVLDPRPLVFAPEGASDADAASDRRFYTDPPAQRKGNRNLPGPVETIKQELLNGTRDTKMFLCGHVGSGKSTELNRLAADDEIREEFSVVTLRFEEQEWATLDSSQVLFRIAGEIHDTHKSLLTTPSDDLQGKLRELSDGLREVTGGPASGGTLGVDFENLVAKVKKELKLSQRSREKFREFGETHQSLLQDVLREMVDAVEDALDAAGRPPRLLVLADDMDKVRGQEQQKEIFDQNLSALVSPPLRIVYTLPTGVYFGENRADVRQNVQHLYPVRVLNKARNTFKPEEAYTSERIGFFETLVHQRVAEGLIAQEAIKLAAIYSGGVLRDFFRLLRSGIQLARYNKLEVLDAELMSYAVDNARLQDSAGLYTKDYEALATVHQTNELPDPADRRYLDTSRVLECYNGAVWFEASPLLWKLLGERSDHG